MTGKKDERREDSSLQNFIAGGIAGTVSKTAIAPLERVKILFQIGSSHYPYSGVIPTLTQITKREGFLSLYKGNFAMAVRIFPYAAIQFMTYEKLKKLFVKDSKVKLHPFSLILCGSIAGATAVMFTYPLDLIRTRLAFSVEKRHYTGIIDGFKKIISTEGGVKSLYKGIMPTIGGIIPYAGVNFGSYETLKWIAPKNPETKQPHLIVKIFCGGLAGCIGQTFAYPFDLIRRQMQIVGFVEGRQIPNYRNMFHAAECIVKTNGVTGLFRGLTINYMKAAPSVGISFATFEVIKKYIS